MGAFRPSIPPIVFTGTLVAILVAHVFYNTTIVIRLVGGALSSLDPRLSQSAATLGATPWRVRWNVVVPLVRPSLLAAALLVFLFDFTSFGVILLLGGPSFATLEVQIYIQALQMLDLAPCSPLVTYPIAMHAGLRYPLLTDGPADIRPVNAASRGKPTRATRSPLDSARS